MNKELYASLCILAHVVRADSKIRSEERMALDALGERDGGASATQLIHDTTDLDALLREVTSPELRRRTLVEAVALANIDGKVAPEELAVIERIRIAFGADALNLAADAREWWYRDVKIREALERATTAYLHKVHAASHEDLSPERYEKLVNELALAKREIQQAFRDVVERAEAGE
jgi:uncharacterized tellurite resistance protein B-like protein